MRSGLYGMTNGRVRVGLVVERFSESSCDCVYVEALSM